MNKFYVILFGAAVVIIFASLSDYMGGSNADNFIAGFIGYLVVVTTYLVGNTK